MPTWTHFLLLLKILISLQRTGSSLCIFPLPRSLWEERGPCIHTVMGSLHAQLSVEIRTIVRFGSQHLFIKLLLRSPSWHGVVSDGRLDVTLNCFYPLSVVWIRKVVNSWSLVSRYSLICLVNLCSSCATHYVVGK